MTHESGADRSKQTPNQTSNGDDTSWEVLDRYVTAPSDDRAQRDDEVGRMPSVAQREGAEAGHTLSAAQREIAEAEPMLSAAQRDVADRLRRAFGRERSYAVGELDQFAQRISAMLETSATSAVHRTERGALGTRWTRRRIPAALNMRALSGTTRYVVASLVLGIVVLVVGKQVWQHRMNTSVSTPMLTYTTANGQRANVTLPDGSTVALNVASRLDVPADYIRGNHTLHLRGEALFTAIHQSRTPLTVVAGAATARVLGTSFVVRHYATDTTAVVAVRNGKVAVRSVVVAAQQQVSVDQQGVTYLRPALSSQFSFVSGILTLDDMSLSEAIAELNRWYDADIRLGDAALATQRIKGKFAAGSLADLSAILSWTFDVRVVRTGRVLTLYPRG